MRKLYPDNEKTQEIYNQDDNKATKQDIQDLSNQIEAVDDKVDNVADNLSNLQTGLAQAVNTNVINANEANIAGTVNATDVNTTNVDTTNIDADNADVDNLQADSATIASATVGDLTVNDSLNTGTLNTGDINSSGNISTPNGSVTADQGHFGLVVTQGLQVQNYTAESIDGQFMSATNAHFGDLAVNGEATIKELEAQEAAIDGLETEEIDIRNISWTRGIDWTHWSDGTNVIYLPHFENGTYHIQIRTANDVPVLTMEISNSVDNYFVRWSQDKIGRLLRIRQIHEGEASFIEFDVNKDSNERWDCYYSTVCQTRNVDAPMRKFNPSTEDVVARYKVEYLNGSKFFKLVDLANDSSSGARLVKTATSERDLATQHYTYDGTTVVHDYDYLPDQSLNKTDDVEFYGLQVHDFETDNLNVPGDFKAKHIYDGPTLTAAQKAALPDDTLLIEQGQAAGIIPKAYGIGERYNIASMSDFYNNGGNICKWSTDFTGALAGGDLEEEYPGANIKYFDYDYYLPLEGQIHGDDVESLYILRNLSTNNKYITFFAVLHPTLTGNIGFSGLVPLTGAKLDTFINSSGLRKVQDTDLNIKFTVGEEDNSWGGVCYDDNGDIMLNTYNSLSIGDTIHIGSSFEDSEEYIVESQNLPLVAFQILYTTSSGNAAIYRKTTKSSTTQVKPFVPYDENGTSATDDRPLVYDTTSDTIKKATGDITAPADLSVLGDLSVAGDTEYTGDTTFNGDVTIGTAANPKTLTVHGDATVHDIEAHSITANDDLFVNNNAVINGDLEVRGTTFSSEVENVQSDGDWIVLRANNGSGLANGDYAGIVFHKYNAAGKDASITVDNSGTFRLSTQTEESVSPLLNTWLVDEEYFTGNVDFSQATLFSENYPVTRYSEVFTDIEAYKKNGNHYFYDPEAETIEYHDNAVYNTVTQKVELAGNVVSFTPDPSTDTPHEVHFYTSISFMEPQASDMEPILTRDEEASMDDMGLLRWDATQTRAKTIAVPTMNNQALTAQIIPADPGIDAHIITVRDVKYNRRYPGSAYTGEIPADATVTPEEVDGSNYSWYYSETLGRILNEYPNDKYVAIAGISYQASQNRWTHLQAGIYTNLPEDAVEIETPTAAYYYKAATQASTSYQWKSNVGGGGLSFVGTRAQYETARLIPEGQDGYIGPNTLVTFTDEDDYVKGDNR